jgi:hypothetical protein
MADAILIAVNEGRPGRERSPVAAEADQKTEAPTPRRRQEAERQGDLLQSKEIGTALVLAAGAAGPG